VRDCFGFYAIGHLAVDSTCDLWVLATMGRIRLPETLRQGNFVLDCPMRSSPLISGHVLRFLADCLKRVDLRSRESLLAVRYCHTKAIQKEIEPSGLSLSIPGQHHCDGTFQVIGSSRRIVADGPSVAVWEFLSDGSLASAPSYPRSKPRQSR
jgi:hypothetical protein